MAGLSAELQTLWLGQEYERGWRGRRVLLVAEALPEAAEGFRIGRGFEASLTESYLDGSMKNRQFTDAARVLLGEVADRADCEDLFRHLSLVNLPRVPLRAHPTQEDWNDARDILGTLLVELLPQAVVLMGVRLAQELTESIKECAPWAETVTTPHPGTPGFDVREHWMATSALRELEADARSTPVRGEG